MNKKLILLLALNALIPCSMVQSIAFQFDQQLWIPGVNPGVNAPQSGKATAQAIKPVEAGEYKKENNDSSNNKAHSVATPKTTAAQSATSAEVTNPNIAELDAVIAQLQSQTNVTSEKSNVEETPSRFARLRTWASSYFSKKPLPEYTDTTKHPLNKGEKAIIELFKKSGTHEKRYLRYLLEQTHENKIWAIVQIEQLILGHDKLGTLQTLATAYGYKMASISTMLKLTNITETEIIILMRKTETIKKIIATITNKPTLETYTTILNTFASREAHLTWNDMSTANKLGLVTALKSKKCGPYMACFCSEEVDKLDPELRKRYTPLNKTKISIPAKKMVTSLAAAAATYGVITYTGMKPALITKVITPEAAAKVTAAGSAAITWNLYNAGNKVKNLRWKRGGRSYPIVGQLPRLVDASKLAIGFEESVPSNNTEDTK
ncbi:MAG TPA: hypothetical protein VGT41_02465 [Candidatus Babeliales bacterium]|nr:hypothetical protein [Candidatus Babeliales bacterium]